MRFHEALTKAGVKNQLLTIHDKVMYFNFRGEPARVDDNSRLSSKRGITPLRSKNDYSGSFMPLLP